MFRKLAIAGATISLLTVSAQGAERVRPQNLDINAASAQEFSSGKRTVRPSRRIATEPTPVKAKITKLRKAKQ